MAAVPPEKNRNDLAWSCGVDPAAYPA